MDGMHYGNLWNKLGRQLREKETAAIKQAWVSQHAATLQRLVTATTAHLRTCGAQPLANIAHGAAHVGLPAAIAAELFGAATEAAEPELGRWAPRHLANLAWACAHAGHGGGARFYTALAAASRPQLAAFNLLELGMLAAAFAKVNHSYGYSLSYIRLQPQLHTVTGGAARLHARPLPRRAAQRHLARAAGATPLRLARPTGATPS